MSRLNSVELICGQQESTPHVVFGPIRQFVLARQNIRPARLPRQRDDAGGPGGGIFVVGKLRRTRRELKLSD